MRRLFRFNRIYYRLFLFFAALVLISALVQGILSLRYYSARYEAKIEELDKANMEKIKEELEKSIISRAHEVYIQAVYSADISPDLNYYFSANFANVNFRIYSLQSKLKNLVLLYGDAIRSIDLYNQDRQTIVSSDSGVIYYSEDNQRFPLKLELYHWLKDIPESTAWLPTRRENALIYSFGATVAAEVTSYKVNYPIGTASPHNKGMIVINLNGKFIANLLQNMNYSKESDILLLDKQNNLLGHSDYDLLQKHLDPAAAPVDFIPSDTSAGLLEYEHKRFIVTRSELNNGWILLKMTPLSDYYADVGQIRHNLIVFSLLTILLGLFLSTFFSFRLYRPVKAIIENTNRLFGRSKENPARLDEYEIISEAIKQLSSQVKTLEQTLEQNASLLKNNVIQDLFNDQYTSRADLDTALVMAGLTIKKPWSFCLLIQFNQDMLEKLSLESRQFINLDLISQAESLFAVEDCSCIGTILNRHTIGFVLGSTSRSLVAIEHVAELLFDYVSSNYHIDLAAAISSPVPTGTFLLGQYYKEAADLLRYAYFMIDTKLFSSKTVADRENSTEQIPLSEIDELARLLLAGENKAIESKLGQLIDEMIYGQYSYLHCQQRQLDIMQAISRYARDQGVRTKADSGSEIAALFFAAANVADFYAFAWSIIAQTLAQIEQNSAEKTDLLITRAKQYIEQNLTADLSLDLLAEQLAISSGYLSRLFKLKTGMNFVSYINTCRLEKARSLLLQSSLTVEEISLRAGFNSTNYFIRKFRYKYGDSPQAYRVKSKLIETGS